MADALMFAVTITGAMVDDFALGELVPVFDDDAPDDDHVIRSEADFDLLVLSAELRRWLKGGTEEQFRTALRKHWPLYADAEFPGLKTWLHRDEAEALVELELADWVEMGTVEEAFEAWGLL